MVHRLSKFKRQDGIEECITDSSQIQGKMSEKNENPVDQYVDQPPAYQPAYQAHPQSQPLPQYPQYPQGVLPAQYAQAGPTVHVIYPPRVKATVYEEYQTKRSLRLGAIQVSAGLFSLLCNVVAIALQNTYRSHTQQYVDQYRYYPTRNFIYNIGFGFWCSIFYILAGAFALKASKRKTRCPVITNLVLSIFAALFAVVQIALSATGICIDGVVQHTNRFYTFLDRKYQWIDVEYTTEDWALIQGSLAMGCFLLLAGLVEFVAAVWSSSLACRVTCNKASPRTKQYVATPQQILYVTNQAGSQPRYVVPYLTPQPAGADTVNTPLPSQTEGVMTTTATDSYQAV